MIDLEDDLFMFTGIFLSFSVASLAGDFVCIIL